MAKNVVILIVGAKRVGGMYFKLQIAPLFMMFF